MGVGLKFWIELHNWINSCILISLWSEVFSVEKRVENEVKWYCFASTEQLLVTNNSIAVFFFLILFNYAMQGKFITWLVNSALHYTWKQISLHDSCDIGFCMQVNMEFPHQVMNFLIEFLRGTKILFCGHGLKCLLTFPLPLGLPRLHIFCSLKSSRLCVLIYCFLVYCIIIQRWFESGFTEDIPDSCMERLVFAVSHLFYHRISFISGKWFKLMFMLSAQGR